MDTQSKSISSQATLSALAGMLFFAPFVKRSINKRDDYSEEEKNFVLGYVQIGFINLILLLIVVGSAIAGAFIKSPVLTWITNITSYIVYVISAFSFLTCIGGLAMRNPGESMMQKIPHKGEIIKAYTPILNFVLWFRQTSYDMPYRWLKESVLLWSGFIAFALLFGSYAGIGMLIIIVVRLLSLMMNIDIVPLNMKKNINSAFSCYPWEMVSYLATFIRCKVTKEDPQTILQAKKEKYAKGGILGANIIVQYILFAGILVLLYHNIDISLMQIVLAVALFLFIIKTFIFYKNKGTLPHIPILSELVSLIIK